VLDAVRSGTLAVVASWDLAEEVADVLRRPRIRRYGIREQDVLDLLVVMAPFLPGVEVDVAVRDPNDAPVVAAALGGAAEAIVTGDSDLLAAPDLMAWLAERGIDVLTPRDLLDRLG
jgi:putative PIN family toxin of toxin-antitoxin system